MSFYESLLTTPLTHTSHQAEVDALLVRVRQIIEASSLPKVGSHFFFGSLVKGTNVQPKPEADVLLEVLISPEEAGSPSVFLDRYFSVLQFLLFSELVITRTFPRIRLEHGDFLLDLIFALRVEQDPQARFGYSYELQIDHFYLIAFEDEWVATNPQIDTMIVTSQIHIREYIIVVKRMILLYTAIVFPGYLIECVAVNERPIDAKDLFLQLIRALQRTEIYDMYIPSKNLLLTGAGDCVKHLRTLERLADNFHL